MRIGIDLRALEGKERSGVGEYTAELIKAILAVDQTNEYFLFHNAYKKSLDREFTGQKVNYIQTELPNKLFNASTLLFKRPHIDRLYSKNLDIFFSPNLNFTALNAHVKHILTIHDISFSLFPEHLTLKQRLWHRLVQPKKQCQNAQRIITPSENTRRDLITHFGIRPEKISVIYPGYTTPNSAFAHEITTSSSTSPNNTKRPYILFLGTTEPRKNILALLRGYEAAYPDLPTPYDLVIAGAAGWKQEGLSAAIAASPLNQHIKLLGYIDPADKAALIKQAAVFVYPSWYEGFGFPVLEALAAGTPVISSNRSSLLEVADDACYLIQPHHPLEIRNGLKTLIINRSYREEKIKKGLLQAQKFTWQKAAEQWLSILS